MWQIEIVYENIVSLTKLSLLQMKRWDKIRKIWCKPLCEWIKGYNPIIITVAKQKTFNNSMLIHEKNIKPT